MCHGKQEVQSENIVWKIHGKTYKEALILAYISEF